MKWNDFLNAMHEAGVKSVTFEFERKNPITTATYPTETIAVGDVMSGHAIKSDVAADKGNHLEGFIDDDILNDEPKVDTKVKPEVEDAESEPEAKPKPEVRTRSRSRTRAESKAKTDKKPDKKNDDEVSEKTAVNIYDAFIDVTSKDDGSLDDVTKYIDAFSLSDLVRVNNEFKLGLDTDVSLDELRSAVLECFSF